jgi:hypothetical protein
MDEIKIKIKNVKNKAVEAKLLNATFPYLSFISLII